MVRLVGFRSRNFSINKKKRKEKKKEKQKTKKRYLDENNFTGSIPTELGNLVNLQYL